MLPWKTLTTNATHGMARDLRLGVRHLLRWPLFSGIAVAVLALGIGATTAIFSVLYGVLLKPLPFAEPGRLLQISETRGEITWTFSEPNFQDLRELNGSFEDVGAFTGTSVNLTGSGPPARFDAARVSAEFFRVLGVDPRLGRLFLAGEDEPGHENRVAILSHRLWQAHFGGDPAILNQRLTLNDQPYTVIGVLPAGEPWLDAAEIFIPMVRDPERNREDHRVAVVGRLRDGVSAEAALADLERLARRLEEQYPKANEGMGFRLTPSAEWVADADLRRALWVLMGAVGFVLGIACVNVANLELAQAMGRRRDSAVCTALGAGRGRIVREVLIQSTLLGLTGGVLGMLLAAGGIHLLRVFGPGQIPRLAEIGLNAWVLGFAVLAALVTSLASGLLPALQSAKVNLQDALRDSDRGSAGSRRQHRIRNLLVAVEIALSLVLLVGAGLMIRSFVELYRVEPGFRTENRLSFSVNLPDRYREDERWWRFLVAFRERAEAIPQVVSVGAVSIQPIGGGSTSMYILAEGRTPDPQGNDLLVDWRVATPEYFRTMGITLQRGQGFTGEETSDSPLTVVVSRELTDRLWPGEDPIGRRALLWKDRERIATVIGVVDNMRDKGLQLGPTMTVYLPYSRVPWPSVTFVVRAAERPRALLPALRTALAELDPNLPMDNVRSLDELVTTSLASRRFHMLLLATFAGVALLLALAGLYGVLAYSVARRTREIGVRMALGAGPATLLGQTVAQGMRPVVAGIVVGLAATILVSRLMTSLLFGITASDPVTYVSVALILAGTALGSCSLAAVRALRIDPVRALQKE